MHKIILATIALLVFSFAFACGGGQNATGGGSSPTDSYKKLFAAVKNKDIEAIKKQLTKKTIDLGVAQAKRNKKPIEQVYENGFTATTFSDTLPNIRDERIKDDMGSLEVWNTKESKWEDLPYINEDGMWKLAVGDVFANTYKQPGFGRDRIEKEAANAMANSPVLPTANSNSITVSNTPLPPATPNNKAK